MRKLIHSCYICVTGVTLPDRAQFLSEVERLVASHTLHGSESLCKLLRYLAKQAVEHPGVPVKEYQIATEVFGRQSDFDPQLDSMVRVQAGRLRSKLAEYYSSEGANDATLIELPKGSYAVVIHDRATGSSNNGHFDLQHSAATEQQMLPRNWVIATVGLSVAFVIAAALAVHFYMARRTDPPGLEQTAQAPAPFRIFWRGVLTGPEEPWVIFSNAAFVGAPSTGMRYYDASKDRQSPILDHYTGVGEVLGVHALDTVFTQLGGKVRVKRGSLFTLDDAKNNDLVFIGSPSENLSLLDIPGSREFQFRSVPAGPRKGNMEIVNVHPSPGEAAEYLASPANVPLTEDYAIIALAQGLDHEHSVLILAGTTTIGTQAAVEFASTEEAMELLLGRLSVSAPAQLKPFEALIHVKVARGVPVENELVAIRKTG
jgi:hypothetical protein